MTDKQTVVLASLLFSGLSASSIQALDCTVVAKLYMTEVIKEVSILRAGAKKPVWATAGTRQLCAGDVVTVPKRSPQSLTVRYYTETPFVKTLKAGEIYQVKALDKPCGTWCTGLNGIKRRYHKLTESVPENTSDSIGAGREGGDDNDVLPVYDITMPLDAGDGFEYPFYLFARKGAVPLFWEDGQPPYQLEVQDTAGNVIVRNTLKTNMFSITVPNTDPTQTYTLNISSAHSVPYRKKLVFAMPPFPLDPKTDKEHMLATLLNDPNKNWRLEIWRQLAALPETQKRKDFKAHLILDDVE